jgi:hypothetical protein
MKKNILSFIILIVSVSLVSCFNDDSSLGNAEVSDITISGIESAYSAKAFVGQHIQINPTIESGYSENELEYQWMLISDKTGKITASGDTIQPIIISDSPNLDYEVNCSPGNYQLRFIVQNKNNRYTVYKYASVAITTSFSQGFYIMKETADGNTELDILNEDGNISSDAFLKVKGSSLAGKPVNLNIDYGMCYIDDENSEMATSDAVAVTTDANNFCVSRSSDLKTIITKENLSFEPVGNDEIVYGLNYTQGLGHVFHTSAGIRHASGPNYDGSLNSGKFSDFIPEYTYGGSRFFVHDVPSYGGIFLWDESSHSLVSTDYLGQSSPLTYSNLAGEEITQNLTQFDCVACGYNYMSDGATAIFILENSTTKERYLYQTESGFDALYLKSRTKIPSQFHIAKTDVFSVNSSSAKYIYCVDNNKIYATVFANDELTEVEIPVNVPANETITYVGNQFYYGDFNYFVVGTQSGNNYKLYFFNLVGGAPDGDAVLTAQGTGTVKSVKYLHSGFNTMFWYFNSGYNAYN